jgi:hypothetical protein
MFNDEIYVDGNYEEGVDTALAKYFAIMNNAF